MVNLEELAKARKNEGYSDINAEARVCQDIVLKAISKSDLNRNTQASGCQQLHSLFRHSHALFFRQRRKPGKKRDDH